VTFLFTDIEGSTQLLASLGDAYGPVLETHSGLIREAITAHTGTEVSTEGDAFFAVFASALDAVQAAAAAQGVTESVRFIDRFVGRTELGTWLEAADVFVTPYPNLDQIVSGTLSYAMASGKPIVSTPYAYARERLAGGRGTLVAPQSSRALAEAFVELLGDRERRLAIGARAYAYSRAMIWSTVGTEYARIFARAALPVPAPVRTVAKLAAVGG